jgi:hypothetical protein
MHIVHVLCSQGGTRRVRQHSCVSCCTASFITDSIETVVEAVSGVQLGVLLAMCRVASPGQFQPMDMFRGIVQGRA